MIEPTGRRRSAPRRLVRIFISLSTLALVLGLAACGSGGGNTTETPTVSPQASPAVVPTAVPPLVIGDVVWTTSVTKAGEPGEVVDAFPRDTPVVYAAARVEHARKGTTLSATWTLNGSSLPTQDQSVTLAEDSDDGWVAFAPYGPPGRWD